LTIVPIVAKHAALPRTNSTPNRRYEGGEVMATDITLPVAL
jgi:hypothetical protein